MVVKASGLAAGKGVVVANSRDEACAAVDEILGDKKYGSAGNRIIVEEKLSGEEISVIIQAKQKLNPTPLLFPINLFPTPSICLPINLPQCIICFKAPNEPKKQQTFKHFCLHFRICSTIDSYNRFCMSRKLLKPPLTYGGNFLLQFSNISPVGRLIVLSTQPYNKLKQQQQQLQHRLISHCLSLCFTSYWHLSMVNRFK